MYNRDEIQLMVQVARLYYENDMNQEMIASRMNLTRQKVSRLLISARTLGIVRISIHDPNLYDPELAQELKAEFGLHDVILVSSEGLENEQLRSGIGLAAAEYLQKTLQDGQVVGLGWGRTVFATVDSLGQAVKKQVHVVPIIGGIGNQSPFFQVNELARRLAGSLGGTYRSLYAPAFIEDGAVLTSLLKTDEIAQVVALWDSLDVVIVGIGHIQFQQISAQYFADHISPPTLGHLEARGTVGDICAQFFDAAGAPVDAETGVVGIPLERLRTVPEVIAVVGGTEKPQAVLGALHGGYIKTLVTDTATAHAILAEKRGLHEF
ncbi:MAG: sugar-binding transcriptional regulator [Chloroflexi bacterium]|nr:sugar-binding transcriptional regulator [Anaerolineaceae bacterium]NMB90094.1 sugar-binding transcriptional regulator [Chloroflexota bacterium]